MKRLLGIVMTAVVLAVSGCVAQTGAPERKRMFTDISRQAGVALWGQGKCATFGDFDEDGFLDLYVSIVYGPNRLFHNNRDGTFGDVTVVSGTGSPADGHGAVFADFNNRGGCDLLVASDSEHAVGFRRTDWPPNHLYIRRRTVFVDCAKRAGIAYPQGKGKENRAAGVAVADIDNDGFLDIYFACGGYKASPNFLYRNVEQARYWCRFDDVTAAAGVTDFGKGYVCAFADVDGDGDQDLYTGDVFHIKEKKQPNRRLFRNDGKGKFADVTAVSGLGQEGGNVGAAFGDIDNDGDLDLYISNLAHHNLLYLNNGDGTFVDVTGRAGVSGGDVKGKYQGYRGCIMGDVNNDGYLDIYVASGSKRDLLFLNKGDGTFVAVESGIHVPEGHGCVFGDIDNDGDLDLYVTSWAVIGQPNSGYFKLFRNETNNRKWIKVRVKGTTSNHSAIGAKIYLYEHSHCGERKHLVGFREIGAGTGVFSTAPLEQHFGLPKMRKYDVEVVFPTSGKTARKIGVSPATIVEVTEPKK